MRAKIAFLILPLATASFAGSACAMTSPTSPLIDCRVLNASKLPAASGGSEALCAAIAKAAEAAAPAGRFSVEVRVLGSSSLAATLTAADGRKLAERRFASSDRSLTKSSFDRFAKALVAAAKADGR